MYKHKKKFGQHFLHDAEILDKIVSSANLCKGQKVWEIGAGSGSLTEHLLKKDIELTIFEIDDDLIPTLKRKYLNKCEIINTDILSLDWSNIIKDDKIKVVTNLPYQISSPFLYRISKHHESFETVVVMLQKEVAKRVCAKPSSKDYGVLSLRTQFYFNTEYLFDVSADRFTPPPNVESAVIRLLPRKDIINLNNPIFFWYLIETTFMMKRKTLKNNLMRLKDKGENKFTKPIATILNQTPFIIDLNRRGETLSEEEFIILYEFLLQFITR